MKVCVSLRATAPTGLRSGNIRSEERWERQALEACLENSEITDVFTCGFYWEGSSPKYRGILPHSEAHSCILLMQDWKPDVVNSYKFKAALVNIFCGPWFDQKDDIQRILAKHDGNLFFTMGFSTLYRNELEGVARWGDRLEGIEIHSHLTKFVPREHVLLLPVPGAPYISEGSNFGSKKLIWAQRLIYMLDLESSYSLLWTLKMLHKDPSLSLDIVTGWKPNEVKDWINEQVVYQGNIVDVFWNMNSFAPFKAVRDRVRIHLDLSWEEVLRLYNEAKLLTIYGRLFGGAPIEAGMHGVPFVGSMKNGALGDCELYQYASEEGACVILDQLNSNEEFYTRVSNSYRDYVREHYTYEAFNRNLNKILADRNLHG